MRIFGLPHFIIAVLFVMSSRRFQQRRNQLIFVGLLAVGTVFCVLFNRLVRISIHFSCSCSISTF